METLKEIKAQNVVLESELDMFAKEIAKKLETGEVAIKSAFYGFANAAIVHAANPSRRSGEYLEFMASELAQSANVFPKGFRSQMSKFERRDWLVSLSDRVVYYSMVKDA